MNDNDVYVTAHDIHALGIFTPLQTNLLCLWGQDHDTSEIASRLNMREPEVYNALSSLRGALATALSARGKSHVELDPPPCGFP